jgi:Carboxypeptidase regulatory-like domain
LALNKPLLPCLLDETPLPPSLAAIEAVPRIAMSEAVRGVLFPGRDCSAAAQPSSGVARGRPKTWTILAAGGAGILAAIAVTIQFILPRPPSPGGEFSPARHASSSVQQTMAGSVSDETGEPVPSVEIFLSIEDKVLATGKTDDLGRFAFQVAALAEANVTLVARKNGYHTEKRYTHLGNAAFNFRMRRMRE